MNLSAKIFSFLFLLAGSFSYGQMKQYNYKRELKGVSEQWHKIILPDDLFGKVSQDLSDLRIFGITASNDTIEAPYLLRLATEKILNKEVGFKVLNTSHNSKGYYFTFEVPTTEPVNQVLLNFSQLNFDWRITLEGSQDMKEWFTMLNNYRILSIKNELTDFQFTKLTFPASKYRYFRLQIESKVDPGLTSAEISLNETQHGTFREYSATITSKNENKQTRQTEINLELPLAVPVNYIKIGIADTFDYYRPVLIEYLTDSFHTEKGWKYNYSELASGTLNSMEENELKFPGKIVRKIKILISNQDNSPLTIDTIQIKGYEHELVARFTENANYYLVYGSSIHSRPDYDINRFTDKIPAMLSPLELGQELTIDKEQASITEPLFRNKAWLWSIMIVIIVTLGWFSLKMMRSKN